MGRPVRIRPRHATVVYIREHREAKGLTQEQLADRLGVTKGAVSRWEAKPLKSKENRRTPDINVLAAIAEALGIHVETLYHEPGLDERLAASVRKPPVAYLRDHRKARRIRVPDIASRMGIERESVYRLERRAMGLEDHSFLDVGSLAQYAAAIGEENPLKLFYPPDAPSLDELLRDEPSRVRALAADLVRTLINARPRRLEVA